MVKRTPEQFLKEEGMTIDTAKRIYGNILSFICLNPHIGCMPNMATTKIIQECFTAGTNHAGGTSARQFLTDIGEDNNYFDLDFCDDEHCDYVDCCMRDECNKYQKCLQERWDEETERIARERDNESNKESIKESFEIAKILKRFMTYEKE